MTFLTPAIMSGEDWRALELAVARIMSHCGWTSVQDVARSGDKGADILAVRRVSDQAKDDTYLVQVKSVGSGTYVGLSALQQALDAQGYYGARIVVIATNGDFTKSVVERAKVLNGKGFNIRLWNGKFLYDLLAQYPEDSACKQPLRPYQQQVCDKILSAVEKGEGQHLIVLATGLGKTTVSAAVTDILIKRGFSKALVLCHSVDLASQLQREFWNQLSKSVPTRHFSDGEPPVAIDGVNFGLYQTMYNYLGGISKGSFDLVIVDEAHHALANAFALCVNHLKPRVLIGMTATPERGDGRSITALFGEPVIELSLVDGMRMGYLAQVDYRLMCDNINWDELSNLSDKPVSIGELNKRTFLPQRDDAVIDEILRVVSQEALSRIIIFSPSVAHSDEFARKLSTRGIRTANLSIPDKIQRRSILMEFAAGRISAVTAVDVLNEGIDVPQVNLVVFLRATHSRRIFVQQLGRGLRLAPGKEKVIVLDFVSDLRRISAVQKLGREIQRKYSRDIQRVWLVDSKVSFSSSRVRAFADAYLQDKGDIEDLSERNTLLFPKELDNGQPS
jgi:superfamily II DNA or RNA helicase